ncbi:MAG: hypothetical protein Q8L48_06545 [Archangium sp.]|nr:hypothetical protein [Archangium sp.]
MAEETHYEFVQRRRAEGAAPDVLNAELVARGLDRDDVALLLGQQVVASRDLTTPAASGAEGTPWALVKKLRAEGFPPDAVARELELRGHARDDIEALLADETVRPAEPAAGSAGSGASIQLIFGVLLILAGVLLILGGRISLLSLGLIAAGVARAASSFAGERSTLALQTEARRQMATLPVDDPRARCALHREYASIGSCPRCGSFCCARCTPARGFASGVVCMRCQALPEVQAQRQQQASRQAALTLLTAPVMLVFLAALELLFISKTPDLLTALGVVGVACSPWLLLAAVQAKVRSGWPVLVSVVPWLLVEILLTMGSAGVQGGLWLVPLGAAFYGWMNTRQAARLEEALVPAVSPSDP